MHQLLSRKFAQDQYNDSCSDDSYDSSFIDDGELDDDTFYFYYQGNIRHLTDSNLLEAEEKLRNIKG